MFCVGDKVKTRQRFNGRRRTGQVTSVNGQYIYVKIKYKLNQHTDVLTYGLELYPCELEKLRR